MVELPAEDVKEALAQHDEADGSCPLPLWAHVCIDAARKWLASQEQTPDKDEWIAMSLNALADALGHHPIEEGEQVIRAVHLAVGGLFDALVGFHPQPTESPEVPT